MNFESLNWNTPDVACLTFPGKRLLIQGKDKKYRVFEADNFEPFIKNGIRWTDCPSCVITNKEYIILSLIPEFPEYSIDKLKHLVHEVLQYDHAVYCSQMGDYDHKDERDKAEELWEFKLSMDFQDSPRASWCFETLTRGLTPIGKFYNQHFHELSEVYEG